MLSKREKKIFTVQNFFHCLVNFLYNRTSFFVQGTIQKHATQGSQKRGTWKLQIRPTRDTELNYINDYKFQSLNYHLQAKCVLIHGRLCTKSNPKFETSTQKPKISELAFFPHILAQISLVQLGAQNSGPHRRVGYECLAL